MLSKLTRYGLIGALAALGAATVFADPIKVASGKAVLPGAGLEIDLPAKAGVTYNVSASWSFDATKEIFDSRDVIDEIDADGKVAAGNWVLTGYFDAGGCDDVLKGEELDASWSKEVDLWGDHWKVRGGVFTFTGNLGRRPAAILCRAEEKTGRALLLYRFLTDQPETTGQADVMKSVEAALPLKATAASYKAARYSDIQPMRRPEVRNRGTSPANRTVKLVKAKLSLDIPDDGYFWMANESDESDMLDRLMPSLPDVSIEVAVLDGEKCGDVLDDIKSDTDKPNHKAQGLPAGWTAGSTMMIDGEPEMLTCYQASYGALMAGFMQGPTNQNVSPSTPILQALAKATRTQ